MNANHLVERLLGWLVMASWQLTLFIAVVAVAAWLFRKASPRLRHGLWLLVFVKALLPTSLGIAVVAMPWSFGHWGVEPVQRTLPATAQRLLAAPIDTPGDTPTEQPAYPTGATAAESETTRPPTGWQRPTMLTLWWLGLTVITVSGAAGYARLRREAATLPVVDEGPLRVALEGAALAVGLRDADAIDLRIVDRPTGPFLFGIRHPVIVLPKGAVAGLGPDELRAVLAHELIHWRRRDTWIGWLQLAVTALFWFHPLVWWAAARLRDERERCCDDAVLRLGASDRDSYSEAIVRSLTIGRGRPAGLSSPGSLAATGLVGVFERGAAIQQRVENVMNFQTSSGRFGVVSKALLGAFACVFLPMAAVAVTGSTETEIARLSLDTLADSGLRIESDRKVKVEGDASTRITTKWPTTVCLAEVENPDIEGMQLIYSVRVKADLERTASLEMWAHVDGGVYFSRNPNVATFGKIDWKELRIPFHFSEGSRPDKVTLNLIVGSAGTVWVDDIRLLKRPLPRGFGAQAPKKEPVKKTTAAKPAAPSSPYPVILKAVPEIGATEVNPSLDELQVTFDRPMAKGMSWTGGGPEFPPIDDSRKARWINDRTCVLPVNLKRGSFYRVGINSTSYQNFKSANGRPAEHRVLAFSTKGAKRAVARKARVPQIVSMTPENGTAGVDASLKRITVKFDSAMGGGMSWVKTNGRWPGTENGRARWSKDGRTCMLPVTLKPGETYELSLNGSHYVNFQSKAGVPLPATPWSFTTTGE